jgi:acetolactate synthase-1/2/3 large subunit/sulfoacetaldehyde acetyltransferase
MPRLSAGQAVVEALRAEGVPYIFGVVGSAFLEVLDALWGQEEVRFVGARHEQGAAFMALGYALATGRPGVCIAQNGPGVTNLLTGVAAARFTHAPMVVLAGAPMMGQLYKDSFQELDQLSIFRPVCKAVLQVNQPQRIPELLRHAFRVAASGRMGPVLVDLPRDLLNARNLEAEALPVEAYRPSQRPSGDPEQVRRAAALLRGARRPVIVAGWGVMWSEAEAETARLADQLGAPIVTSYERYDAVPNDHPLFIGGLGRAGTPEATEAAQKADVILALGTRLGHFTTFYNNSYIPSRAQIIQVEIEPAEIGRHFPVAVGIWGDARAVAQALLTEFGPRRLPGREERVREATRLREARRLRLEAEGSLDTLPMKPQRFYHALRAALPPGAAIALDAGATPAYGFDRLFFGQPRSLFTSGELGCIGSGFPIALGVKMAQPERPVLSISGDGGFFMNAQELETAVRWRAPTVNIVLNNGCWGSEKAYQKFLYGERYIEADIGNPRYDRLAELCGGRGFYVEHPQDLAPTLREALACGLPAVIEVPIDPEELPYPARVADVFAGRPPA